MDGGRILRAWLARKRDWVRATELAVRVGRVFAIGMILAFQWSGVLSLIGVWVWWMGARELRFVRMKHRARAAYDEARYPGSESGASTPGFTPDDLRDLEAYRGRLRGFNERDD